jgi:hypothetical protein
MIIVVGSFYIDFNNWTPFAPNGFSGVMKGVSAVFFAYIGFDSVATAAEETKNPNYLRAIAGGVIAGIIGGLLWYFIAVLTNREFGYVAIALGFLVGMGVIVGSGGKRGHMLQMIALLLTLFVIFVAEYGIFRHTLNIYIQEHASELNDIDPNMIRDALGVLNPIFLKSLISPIGLVIYAIGAYCAYSIPKPRKI